MGTFVDAPAASVGGSTGGTGGGTVTNNEEAERDAVGEHDEGKHRALGQQKKDSDQDENDEQQQGPGSGQHTQGKAEKGLE
jgi:hypothetical protein